MAGSCHPAASARSGGGAGRQAAGRPVIAGVTGRSKPKLDAHGNGQVAELAQVFAGTSQARFPCGGGGPASEEEDAATKAFRVRVKKVTDAFVYPDDAGHAVHRDDREP